jgi:hypothetical protein
MEGEIAGIGKLRDDFIAQPEAATYAGVVGRCKSLLAALLTDPKDVGNLAQARCESSEIAQSLKPRDDMRARKETFDTTCSIDAMAALMKKAGVGAVAPPGDAAVAAQKEKAALATVQDKIQNCFSLAAALGADISGLQQRFDFYIEANAPDLDAFTKTMHALPWYNIGTPSTVHSYFAAIISVVQDAFILVLSLFAELLKTSSRVSHPEPSAAPLLVGVSDNSDDTAEIRAAKALLRLSMPAPGSKSSLIVDMNAPAWEDVPSSIRDEVAHILRSQQRQRRVRALGGNKFELTFEGAVALEMAIGAHVAQPATGGATRSAKPEPAADEGAHVAGQVQGKPQDVTGAEAPRGVSAQQAFEMLKRAGAVPMSSAARSPDVDRLSAPGAGAPPRGASTAADDASTASARRSPAAKDRAPGGEEDLGPLEARLSRTVGIAGAPKKKGS